MKTTNKIMAIGAHADDIELMFGGTLSKYRALGFEIVYIMSTNNMSGNKSVLHEDGTITRTHLPPDEQMALRKSECEEGARALATVPIHLDHPQRHFNGPDGELVELRYGGPVPSCVQDSMPTILTAHEDAESVRRVADLMLEHDPVCVLAHNQSSLDMEHVGTALLVMKAFRMAIEEGFRGDFLQPLDDRAPLDEPVLDERRVFTGDCELAPAWDIFFGEANACWETFVDISDWVDAKLELVGYHRCQMPTAHYPGHPSRVRVKKWGKVCGCHAAETFRWVRHWTDEERGSTSRVANSLTKELVKNTKLGWASGFK